MARTPEELHRSNKNPSTASGQQARNMPTRDDLSHQFDHAEVVSGRWLVKAILIVLAVAGVALYLTVCLLFYQGQWQFTFSPPKGSPPTAAAVAAKTGLPIADVRFDTTEEGVERLDGWWIPAAESQAPNRAAALSHMVVLFCPNGRTDLADNVDALKAFHALGVNVFAFDYQGFGVSQAGHPSQQKAYANAVAAMNYLTGMRHVPPERIVVYGARLGAAVAAHVARQSPNIAGLILEDPQPSLTEEVKREQHIHLLPMWLVFQDRFQIATMMPSLKMPKLILSTPAMRPYAAGAASVYDEAHPPKQKAAIGNHSTYTQPEWRAAVGNFLNGLVS
ncbi:MAG: alpha/beta hydrolase [Acidobacteriaceae bacterium]